MAELAPAVEIGAGGKRTAARRAVHVAATKEPPVGLDHVVRHTLIALEEVAATTPDPSFDERRELLVTAALGEFEQGSAPSADREFLVVRDRTGGGLVLANPGQDFVDVSWLVSWGRGRMHPR
jgi:DNA-directed RNA polymerase subunit K/omega